MAVWGAFTRGTGSRAARARTLFSRAPFPPPLPPCPQVSRTLTFGENGVSQSQFFSEFLATIKLNDVTPAGLLLRPIANEGTVNCTTSNGVCAWASLQFDDAAATWVNATLAISGDNQGVVLTAEAPSGSTKVVATSYGWGAVPFLTVYLADSDLDLPLMAWNQTV